MWNGGRISNCCSANRPRALRNTARSARRPSQNIRQASRRWNLSSSRKSATTTSVRFIHQLYQDASDRGIGLLTPQDRRCAGFAVLGRRRKVAGRCSLCGRTLGFNSMPKPGRRMPETFFIFICLIYCS